MQTQKKVLDHGYVRILNVAGPHGAANDTDPADIARISFDAMESVRTPAQDLALCEYLLRNMHTSPFEQIQIWMEIKLPIFVARQFVRHRTQALNEVSGRYVTLPAEWYIPERVGGKATNNKQGQTDNLDYTTQCYFRSVLYTHCETGYANYLQAMEEGVAPEHARMLLSLNHYTHWVTSINLHNLMHFLSLRMDEHAQLEARLYGEAIYELLKNQLPELMRLFDKHRRIPRHLEELVSALVGPKVLKELGLNGAAKEALNMIPGDV